MKTVAINQKLLEALQNLLNVTEPTARPRIGDLHHNRENGFHAIKEAKKQLKAVDKGQPPIQQYSIDELQTELARRGYIRTQWCDEDVKAPSRV